MTFAFGWAPDNITGVEMEEQGWQLDNPNASNASPISGDSPTYTGSPTRYSFGFADNNVAVLPSELQVVGHKGAWGVWVKLTAPAVDNLLVHNGQGPGATGDIYIRVVSGNQLQLYVNNQPKGVSSAVDLTKWHYIVLKSNMSTSTWAGELWVDGVQEVTDTHSGNAQTISEFYIRGCSTGNPSIGTGTIIGGIVHYDDNTDTDVETPQYCTWMDVNEDIAGPSPGTVGTWTPSTGLTNYEVVDGEYDITTYTQNTSPLASDRVTMGTSASSGNIASAIGVTPSAIYGISLHTFSTGEAINAKAIISDGTTETAGPTVAISATEPTHAHVGAAQKPTGPTNWTGTDTPRAIYEVQ